MSKLALVVNTLSSGGAERVVSNLSLYLPETVSVDIVVNDSEHTFYPYRGELISLNMSPEADRMSLRYQLCLMLRRTVALRRLKREKGYDAVISFSESANIANILSGRASLPDGRRTKRILSIHNSVSYRKKNHRLFAEAGNYCMKLLYNRADCVTAVSREIGDELQRIGGIKAEKIRVIYNGIDRAGLVLVPYEQAAFEEGDAIGAKIRECKTAGIPVVCSVGRLARQKGQWHLLRVLAELKKQGQPFFLLLMGEGKLRELLVKLTEELGLSEQVMFCGFVEKPYRYLQYADVEACSSLWEGYSNALVEALAMGIPVVSTDHPTGAREILAPGTDYRKKCTEPVEAEFGILTPAFDGVFYRNGEPLTKEESCFAQALRRMLSQEELRKRYREKGLSRTDILMERITQQWMELVEEPIQ